MRQSSDDFAEYHDSHPEYREYGQNAQITDYSHPEYYQEQVASPPPPAPEGPKQERPPMHNPYADYAGYSEYQPTIQSDPYTQEYHGPQQVEDYTHDAQEYRGPQQVEGYTHDAGTDQREASERGYAADGPKKKKGLAGIGSTLVAIGAFLLKFKSLVFLLKFGTASFSILASVAVYALFYGWTFAVGIVAQLFIHEMGHALVMKIKGIPIGGMIFIPMFGAAVTMKQMPQNARDEAEVGIAGPIAGTLAASLCLVIAQTFPGSSVWAPLAYFGFFINLFNLIPIVPFDGGRVLAAIDKRVWFLGFFLLLAFQVWQWLQGSFSIWLLLFVLLADGQLWSRGFSSNSPQTKDYYNVPVAARIALTVLYFGLILVLVLGMTMAHNFMNIGS